MRLILAFYVLFISTSSLLSQNFTRQDSLRGGLRPERTAYDVHFYDLALTIDIDQKAIQGKVKMAYRVVHPHSIYQIDLFENLKVASITYLGQALPYKKEGNVLWVTMPPQSVGQLGVLEITYGGNPIAAKRAPWDGGFVWKKENGESPWVGVACEGTGASLWWPNKDHLSDEPDSMAMHFTVPKPLKAISNGQFKGVTPAGNNQQTWHWFVSYPINNYNVTLNIADYAEFHETYLAADGDSLALNYYVLPQNLAKAKTHFLQVHEMLRCYENYMDKFPYWRDGFALVETPYLGMEHQSCIAYGNGYQRGYLGGMIPSDMDWDYIIIHESGHEYYGNSISCNDHAEMWIHESFTTYLEAVYVECRFGESDAIRYLNGQLPFIANEHPIIGPQGVNFDDFGSSDHYYKGAWILHTLRNAIGDDELWWKIFKGFYKQNAQSNIPSEAFFNYVQQHTGKDWMPFFQQYLYQKDIPVLKYSLKENENGVAATLYYANTLPNFNMSILVGKQGAYQRVHPNTKPQVFQLEGIKASDFHVAMERFLVIGEAF